MLGLGSMGSRRAKIAVALGHSVCGYDPRVGWLEIDAESLASGSCGRVSTEQGSLREAVAPDAVFVSSPASEHAVSSVLAALCGRRPAIFIEKPVATSLDDAETVRQSCAKAGITQVGYSLRYHLGLQLLRDQLPDIGDSAAAAFIVRCDKSTWPGSGYADMLLEASHEIDLALWLFGPADCVSAVGIGERWSLLLRHASGCQTSVILDGAYTSYHRVAVVCGRSGELVWAWRPRTLGGPDWEWVLDALRSGVIRGDDAPDDLYRLETGAFLACVEDGATPGCTLDDGLAVMRICAQARELSMR